MFHVIARGPSRERLGVLPFRTLDVVLRDRSYETWVMELDALDPKVALLGTNTGIIVIDEDNPTVPLLSGPVRTLQTQAEDGAPLETLTVEGVGDTWRLFARNARPQPLAAITAQTVNAYYTNSGVAETVMRTLADLNGGPSALAARIVAGLTLEADGVRGGTVSVSTRFDNLGEVLASLGLAGGVSFRVVQVGSNLVLKFSVPVDRSASVRFSRDLGNLRGYTYKLSAPEATAVVIAGQGEGTARTFRERVNSAAETEWGERGEVFDDRRDTNNVVLLDQQGDETLAEQGPTASLSLTPVDIPQIKFGRDYNVGDTVAVIVGGVRVVEPIRQVRLTVTPEGVGIVPVIGDESAEGPAAQRIYQQVKRIARGLDALQRRH